MADRPAAAAPRTQLQPVCLRTETGWCDRKFQTIKNLGDSGFGAIFEVEGKEDGKKYAVKKIPFPNKERAKNLVLNEVQALLQLRHEHIVQYHDAWLENEPHKSNTSRGERVEVNPQNMSLYIQMELCKVETLEHYLDDLEGSPFRNNRSKQLSVVYQIALAVQCIHEHNLVHGDLKPWSVLFKLDDDTVRIGNFSHAVPQSQERPESPTSSIRGHARNYLSPERVPLHKQQLTTDETPTCKWDIYPIGLMFLELMNPCRVRSAEWNKMMEEAEKLQLRTEFTIQNPKEASQRCEDRFNTLLNSLADKITRVAAQHNSNSKSFFGQVYLMATDNQSSREANHRESARS